MVAQAKTSPHARQPSEALNGVERSQASRVPIPLKDAAPMADRRVLDRTLRGVLVHALVTKQIAFTDGIEVTERASASLIREIAGVLRDPVVLRPGSSRRDLSRDRLFLQQEIYPSVAELVRQIAAANRAIDRKHNEVYALLGNAVSDLEYGTGDSLFRRYERGAIYLSPNGTVAELHGAIYQRYLALKAESGFLGLPVTDEQSTVLGTGRFNHFVGGSIYWTPDTGAWELHGAIRDKWWQLDGDRSYLGYPVSNEENWIDPVDQSTGRISHFQRGNIVFRSSDSSTQVASDSVILTTSLAVASVTCSAELWMNSAGDWRFTGHMHNSGFVGFNVTVVSTPRFQDDDGNIFAPNAERHIGGTTSADDRNDDWDQVGNESFIREHWDSLRFAGMRTVLEVNTTFGDVVQLIGAGLPIAVGVVIVGAILGGGKVCGPYGSVKRDPWTGEDNPTVTFTVHDKGEPCR